MTNFDFLKNDKQFELFADTAIAAERVFTVDFATCAVNCRRAAEFAVKWMYSVDSALVMPYQDNLVTLMNTDEFQDIVGRDIYQRLEYIRKIGNNANHNPKTLSKDQTMLALKNLHTFMDFISYCYGVDYQQHVFDESQFDVELRTFDEVSEEPAAEVDLNQLRTENAPQMQKMTLRREEREDTYIRKPIDFTEEQTRKAYIDVMLTDVGWIRGKNWINEYPISEMPNKSNFGSADYVLLGDDGKPLAIIEAKKTSVDVAKGRQQAKLYADDLQRRFGKRPIIFLTNGYDTRIWIDQEKGYPERTVSGIYSKRDLEKEFNKMAMRTPLTYVKIKEEVADRYYQKAAIKATCEAFDERNRRKALLVMATGSGKTRTVISLIDVLIENGWVTNFLFLADRNSLVTQAKRAFHNLMPDLSLTNLVEEKDNTKARGVFSTYQTMMNCIDESKDEDGDKLFTCGHFDLLVVDEAHRSIYKKYQDIFTYFDALLVGLTATPKNDIDKNTYGIFDLEAGVPTYGYDLAQAVEDHYLVDYTSIETKLKFPNEGIVYDDLTDDEKAEYEEKFSDENGDIPESIGGSALNEWVFNKDTIRKVLNMLMTFGLKVEYGSKIGKTVIFAKSHRHAEKILQVWNKEYPHYPAHFCRVIDNYTNYAQSLIDDFSDNNKMPQIVISVDMLDTGIDVPEILNLVFFKKVLSISKFWQMIGRGTRLCEGLIDGVDKKEFYIFDFCSNFEFFRIKGEGKEAVLTASLQEQLFQLKTDIVFKLQSFNYATNDLLAFREQLVNELVQKIIELNRENFAVKQHIKYVDHYTTKESFFALSYEDTLLLKEHIAPLVDPEKDEFTAARFDVLIYQIELALLIGRTFQKNKNDLTRKLQALTHYATIPDVSAQKEFIETLLHTDYIDRAGINEFEVIRTKLRDLIKYIDRKDVTRYDTDFTDTIEIIEEHPSDLYNEDLKNYKKKVSYYIRTHETNPTIAKLKGNLPLTSSDMKELETILWSEVGTKEDYRKEYGDTPLGELVRSITGLDIMAAKHAFSTFIDDQNLNLKQIYFLNQIINYIVKNGMMKDFTVLQGSPFNNMGSISDVFEDIQIFSGIKKAIEGINENAGVA